MLQAVVKNKLKRYLIQDGEPPEDLITDCFFGPLRYLNGQDAGRAMAWICQDAAKSGFGLLNGATVSDVELWPRSNGVEPDAHIRCRSPSGASLQVLIEVKWNSPLGQGQAVRQWQGFSGSLGADRLLHLIICRSQRAIERDITKQEEELRNGRSEDVALWRESRLVLTWHEIARRLRDIPSGQSPELQRWVDDTRAVLQRYGERPFEGFARLPSVVLEQPAAEAIFWTHHRTFNWPLTRVDRLQNPVFWQMEK